MSIFRLLFIAAVVYLLWRAGRVLWSKLQPPPAAAEKPYLPMSACSKCGAHVPQDTLTQKGLCGRCAESS